MATNTTILNKENVEQAISAIATYMNTCTQLNASLNTEITNLTAVGASFNGDAANGYLEFYNMVKPAFHEQLLGDETGLMPSLQKILQSIYDALNATLDPNLEKANKNAGANNTVKITPQNTNLTAE